MHICLVSETWTPEVNGVAHTLAQLSGELLARGHQLQLIRPRPMAPGSAEEVAVELQLPGLAVPGYRQVRVGLPSGRRIAQWWRENPPDVVYLATQGPLGWSAQRAARRLGLPVVAGWHTNFDHYCHDYGIPWLAPLVETRLRTFHNRCAATLVPTHSQLDDLRRRGFQGVRCMARGVDGTRFAPGHRDDTLRRRWGAGTHTPVALHVGRLAPEKNLDLLRDSFRAMYAAHPEIRQVIVGDGPSRRSLERSLPEAHFTGFVSPDALARYYASADLFLFPSLSETWGNVLLEAMASGLGVIAFRHAAGAELIDDGRNGLSLDPGDEAGFRDAAVALCQHPARWTRLGRAARSRALGYTWPAITDTFVAALKDARENRHATERPCRV
ncbi:glycosyltransferase family 4 protein [Halomonas icarae]|uniref:Glycosyltransferase n=1 Tax=Halomonas icarae TaxID=2691040 RepID=A0A7X4VXS7_9GAMM|nr:glycosyltransferase family 1 protein [Halomonas icarae]MDR5902323.1 glycosyltransferase family 1 protein [Halomonas icarae]NAW12132.1 glycosyltransferase [Halomonas icarae]